jgi:hypothetical protein
MSNNSSSINSVDTTNPATCRNNNGIQTITAGLQNCMRGEETTRNNTLASNTLQLRDDINSLRANVNNSLALGETMFAQYGYVDANKQIKERNKDLTLQVNNLTKELDKNQKFFLKSTIKGTLNNFYATKLYLVDNKKSIIKGDINFKNLFPRSPGSFYMKGNFNKIASNYKDLIKLLPNILGKKLPSSLQKLGQFTYTGKVEVTQTYIKTNFVMNTALGIVESDLMMSNLNNIDNANYK